MRIGPWVPSLRYDEETRTGTTFRFIARDEDGLPVVGETFEEQPRTSSFEAFLHKLDEDVLDVDSPKNLSEQVDPNAVRLPIQFIGNKDLRPDGSYQVVSNPPLRVNDGLMEVTVELAHTGPHLVRLRGPSGGFSSTSTLPTTDFTWMLLMLGQCPAGQVEVGSRKCSCDRGYTQLGFSAICEPCASGHVKDVYGTEDCDTCVEHVLKKHLCLL